MRKVLLAAAMVALPFFGAASVSASQYEDKKDIKISPIVECVVDNGNDFTVYWGYENKSTLNDQLYTVPADEVDQKFTGGSADLPEEFVYPMVVNGRPGRTAFDQAAPNAFTTTLVSGNQVWTLNKKTATASPNTKECPEQYFAQFEKVWMEADNSDIDFEEVTVVVTADGDFSWTIGTDSPIVVVPGVTELTNVQETVTGLPDNCSYESDLVSTIMAPTLEYDSDEYALVADTDDYDSDDSPYDDNNTVTVTITNTVDCEADDPGQVLGDSDEQEEQVEVVPASGVNAGGATIAVTGATISAALTGAGLAIKKHLA